MILSLTAFARSEAGTAAGSLTWELRSVNHRYLETALRLPEELRGLEPRVREEIGRRLTRGKVDGTLRFQPREASAPAFEVDEPQLARLLDTLQAIRGRAGEALAPSALELLRWPGVLQVAALNVDDLNARALELLAQTLDELVAGRAREGGRLAEVLAQRLDAMEKIVAEVRRLMPETVAAFRERLRARLSEVKQSLDPNRLEQEIVLFVQKSDVAEELDRLTAPLAETRRSLAAGGQIGRRLDFLMQEFNREANTLGSKSVDIRMTNAAVELKVLIEQMREQVQNIE